MCRGRVLVVDDDPELRATLAEVLTASGLEVRLAENGLAALRALESFRPEVVLVDVEMPEMDGRQLVAVLRAGRAGEANRFAVISMSSSVAASAAPARWFLRKPFAMDQLLQVVNDFVAARTQRPRVA